MQRIILVGIAATAMLWAGCARAPQAEGDKVVTFVGWGGPEEKAIFSEAVSAFERDNPDVKVRYTQIPGVGYDYYNKLRMMIAAGIAPDVFYVPDGNFGELVRRGVLLDLEPYVENSRTLRTEDIWHSATLRYRWNGQRLQVGDLYALPKDMGPNAMFYNKDVLRARGVPFPDPKSPMTWDQAIEVWKRLTFVDGRVQHYGISRYHYESAVWALGGDILVPETKVSGLDVRTTGRSRWALDSPIGIEALQWCADLALVHHVAPAPESMENGSNPSELFETQLAAMHIDGRWTVPHFRQLPFDWDVAPLPVPRPGAPSLDWSGSVGLGINARTTRAPAAWRLVEFLAGPQGQRMLTRSGFQIPNQISLSNDDVYRQPGQKPEHPDVFLDAARSSRPGPWTATPNMFWSDVFWNYVGRVFRGETTAAALLPQIAPLVNAALQEMNEP